MGLRDELFAAGYDPLLRASERAGLAAQRSRLLAGLTGEVLELGAGTGANLAAYGPGVRRRWLLEPSPAMRRRLVRRSRPDTDVVLAGRAEDVTLPDASVDAVVATLVLCTVDDLPRTLAEIRRVLRDDGRLVVIEHVAGTGALLLGQRVLAPAWRAVTGGCRLTRDTPAALARAGFDLSGLRRWRLPRAGPAAPAVVGTAIALRS